ncbi:MAG: amidohydrolase, partial [Acidobacteriaceae bacterium]|nr:amidohydrolase [Acidobacteriaceae bacterium]
MNRVPIYVILLIAALSVFAAAQAPHNEVVIRNAVVMTVTHGSISNGSVYIKDGNIAAVGKDVSVPAGATV